MGAKVAFRIWRGDAGRGALTDYQVETNEGEVVLDVLHRLQATQAGDLAGRWNCKAGQTPPAGYQVETNEGEVVLDVLHRLQATQAGDLAVRWNCKAGKCGSCS